MLKMHNFHVLKEKNLEICISALCKTDLKHANINPVRS